MPLVKHNVMKFEIFILGGQRIDQKRNNGWWRGSRERIEMEAEKIEIERKETKAGEDPGGLHLQPPLAAFFFFFCRSTMTTERLSGLALKRLTE